MKKIERIILGLLIGAEAAVAADLVGLILRDRIPVQLFWAVFIAAAAAAVFLKGLKVNALRRIFVTVLAIGVGAVVLTAGALILFAKSSGYENVDGEGKAALFSGKSVLVIAPHQDDELNIAGGVIEEYIRYGSQVRILFTTNGDFAFPGWQRMNEALAVAAKLQVPEENVIFLGYGDGGVDVEHIYNLAADEPFFSEGGFDATYGLPEHPAYNEGNSYTRRHFCEDLRDAVLEYRPDVILSTSYEGHSDHCAAALLLEEAMPEILRTAPDYKPLLLETACYNTAYYAEKDFYSENMLATKDPFTGSRFTQFHIYAWEERVRLPVSTDTLARSLFGSSTYWQLRLHASQGAVDMAESIISGDRVFWQRDTSSLTYTAQVSASSGDAAKLNDFKLLDTTQLWSAKPWDGTWMPAAGDEERKIEIEFPRETDLTEIRLYDNPSPEDNVLNALIRFDGEDDIETGPLRPSGMATVIPVPREKVKRIEIRLLETEGELAGLTEVEVYNGSRDWGLNYVKLQNEDGDFVYDYYIDRSGSESFAIYTSGDVGTAFQVSCDGDGCSARLNGKVVTVSCPKGKSCTVTVSAEDGRFSDSVRVSNPSGFSRHALQGMEKFLSHNVFPYLDKLNSYRLAREGYRTVRYGSGEA